MFVVLNVKKGFCSETKPAENQWCVYSDICWPDFFLRFASMYFLWGSFI